MVLQYSVTGRDNTWPNQAFFECAGAERLAPFGRRRRRCSLGQKFMFFFTFFDFYREDENRRENQSHGQRTTGSRSRRLPVGDKTVRHVEYHLRRERKKNNNSLRTRARAEKPRAGAAARVRDFA